MKNWILILITSQAFFACRPEETSLPIPPDVQLGGETTISGSAFNSFQQPAANLTGDQISLHLAADAAFGDQFVTAPSNINPGLGPVFNQNSCENCHTANGKSPFPTQFDNHRGLLMRLSAPGVDGHGAPNRVTGFGGQLQTRAIFGTSAEAKLSWQQIESIKQYVDGEQIPMIHRLFDVQNPYLPLPANTITSMRLAPAVYGLGLLEAIDAADILANADETDLDQDGISGKPNYVWNYAQNKLQLGRFGWKAGQPNLLQQTAAAYNNDMGITSPYFAQESSWGQIQADGLADEPEIDQALLDVATFYTQSLGVPERRNYMDATVQKGRKLFMEINCNGCHQPAFKTGQHSDFAFLSQQAIWPYTDLLLHDMGPDLADNSHEFAATGSEWRTPPLWGIGMTSIVAGTQAHFLHDGRARTLEEAILWHGGEAEQSLTKFKTLNKADRQAVIRFLESL
jgi:CxxC motif-containing protein (DUF1111 family)